MILIDFLFRFQLGWFDNYRYSLKQKEMLKYSRFAKFYEYDIASKKWNSVANYRYIQYLCKKCGFGKNFLNTFIRSFLVLGRVSFPFLANFCIKSDLLEITGSPTLLLKLLETLVAITINGFSSESTLTLPDFKSTGDLFVVASNSICIGLSSAKPNTTRFGGSLLAVRAWSRFSASLFVLRVDLLDVVSSTGFSLAFKLFLNADILLGRLKCQR